MHSNSTNNILFIDFDGTITSEETLNYAMKMCVPKDMFEEGVNKMKSGEWTLRQAVTYAFDNIPSSRLDDILEYVRGVPIRNGFGELLDKMKELNIPVVIISGGLKPYVEEKLEPYKDRIKDIYSLDIDVTGSTFKLISPFDGTTDLIDKTKVMKQYSYKNAICIGDGLTDIQMAMSSDLVFARDTLAQILTKKNVTFTPWDDFHDICMFITKKFF